MKIRGSASKSRINGLGICLVALLGLSLVSLPAEARKKRNQPKSQETPSAAGAIETAKRSLWAYDTAGAREALELAVNEAEAEVLMATARVLEQEKNYGEAAANLKAAAEKLPADPAPLVFLGETYLHADNGGEAQKAFVQAENRARALLSSEPGNVAALYHLGVAQQRQKKFSEAIATFESARRTDPTNVLIVYQLGVTHAFQQNWNRAVDLLTDTIVKDSGIAYAYYYRGLAAGQAGRKDLLIGDLDRFLFMAPNAPEAERARKVRNAG